MTNARPLTKVTPRELLCLAASFEQKPCTRRSQNSNAHSNKRHSASIDTIQILQPDGTIKSTSSAKEMIPLIIDHNRQHFSQAEGTPFTTGTLRSVEHTACCHRANSILAGTFEAPDISELHSSYIEHLATPQISASSHMLTATLTVDDVKTGYAAWRENTSTSPHGDHLGIYKVLLKDMIRCYH